MQDFTPNPGPYDRIGAADLARVRDARAALSRGDPGTAQVILSGLAERLPENVPVGAMLQEVQLAGLATLPAAARDEATAELAERYRARAEATPHPADLVLAARVEADRLAAGQLLLQALEIDAGCLWAHYGLAWLRTGAGEFALALEDLARARALDPGHLSARRLEINLLARAGELRAATRAQEAWLRDAFDAAGRLDPFLEPSAVPSARVDLATLQVLEGDPADALEALPTGANLPAEEAARADLVRAAALFSLGSHEEALAAARRAGERDPGGSLALVQEALVLEHCTGDLAAARVAWEAAAERLGEGGAEGGDLSWLLMLLRARVRAERLGDALDVSP